MNKEEITKYLLLRADFIKTPKKPDVRRRVFEEFASHYEGCTKEDLDKVIHYLKISVKKKDYDLEKRYYHIEGMRIAAEAKNQTATRALAAYFVEHPEARKHNYPMTYGMIDYLNFMEEQEEKGQTKS